ncbi:MAG: hypothetical protein R3C05_19165 [Pirellulaceae bacterium]
MTNVTERRGAGGTSIDSSGDVTIDAGFSGGRLVVLVGRRIAFPVKTKEAPASADADNKGSSEVKPKSAGFGLSGDVSIHTISGDTRAYINDDGTFDIGGGLTIDSLNTTTIHAGSGSVSLQEGKKSAGIAGSFAQNKVSGGVESFIVGASIDVAGNMLVTARTDSDVNTYAASGTGGGLLGVAGQLTINKIDRTTEAFVSVATVVARAASSVTAIDVSSIFNVSGAISFGGKVGIGAAIALNTIDTKVSANIVDSDMQATGDLLVSAESNADVWAITAAGALGNEGMQVAGSVSVNKIDSAVEAFIRGERTAAGIHGNNITLSATDDTTITADGGGVSAAVGSVQSGAAVNGTIGISTAINEVTKSTRAFIEAATVIAVGAIALNAHSKKAKEGTYSIDTLAIAGAVSGTSGTQNTTGALAGAGAGVQNIINRTVETLIKDSGGSRRVEALGGSVTLSALDQSSIRADSGGFGLAAAKGQGSTGGASVGVSASLNEIGGTEDRVTATIQNSIVKATGNIDVHADSMAQIKALSIGGALAAAVGGGTTGALAGAGAAGINSIGTTIEASITASSNITTTNSGHLSVVANDASNIRSDVVGASLALAGGNGGNAGALAIGVSIARNEIDNRVQAFVDSAFVNANGDFDIHVVESADITALAVAASLSVGASSDNGLSLSGGGAEGSNVILTKANAYANASFINGATIVVRTDNTSAIDLKVVAASASIGLGSSNAGAVSIGAARARNLIGWRLDAAASPAESQAYLKNTSALAIGVLRVESLANQDIKSTVVAGSAAVSGAGNNALGLSGAGVDVTNKVRVLSNAFIDGDGPTGISAHSFVIAADDSSSISAVAVAASLAVAAAGTNAGALSIGVSLAKNEVDNDVQAYIKNSESIVSRGGDIDVTATSRGQRLFELDSAGGQRVTPADLDNVSMQNEDDSDTPANEQTDDEAIDAAILAKLRAQFAAKGTPVSDKLKVAPLAAEKSWVLVDTDNNESYIITKLADGTLEVSSTSIDAIAVAASLAVGVGGSFGAGLSGAGADSTNVILTDTKAYIEESVIESAGAVDIDATSTSSVIATIVAASAAVGVGGSGGLGASIGASIARNYIGFDDAGTTDVDKVSEIKAFVEDSSIDATGILSADAIADQTIGSTVFAGSVAIAVGGTGGVAASGAGVSSTNKIGADVKAFISGDGADGIRASGVTLRADDLSTISAFAGAASIAGAVGGTGAIALSVGVALARNEISNEVEASINGASSLESTSAATGVQIVALENATIFSQAIAASLAAAIGGTAGGGVSGAGAESTNVILTNTNAFVQQSDIVSAGVVDIDAANRAAITAQVGALSAAVGAGGTGGLGVSIGASVARNLIGAEVNGAAAFDFTTDQRAPQRFVKGQLIKVNAGARAGDVYEYVGEEVDLYDYATEASPGLRTINEDDLVRVARDYDRTKGAPGYIYRYLGDDGDQVNLSTADYTNDDLWGQVGSGELSSQDYSDSGRWQQVNLRDTFAQVQAYVKDSSISATGDLTVDAASAAKISANVLAGSAAISGGGVGAVGLSGAGVGTQNKISTQVRATIDGDDNFDADAARGITASSVLLNADDTSTITSRANAVSLAGALAGTGAVALSIGVALAKNEINNTVEAFIINANNGAESTVGAIEIKATENATIDATAAASSVAAAGGLVGIAISGAGAEATNVILGGVKAYAQDSTLSSKTDVVLDASNRSNIDAQILSAAASLGGGAAAGALSIGASIAENSIGFDGSGTKQPFEVLAFLKDTDVDAGGDLRQTATTEETITAETIAASVAIAIGAVGAAGSGSGVSTTNRIANKVVASIDGENSIDVRSADLHAEDKSTITANAAAASVALAFTPFGGGAIAIGVTLSENIIQNEVLTSITDATVNASGLAGVSLLAVSEPTITSDAKVGAVSVGVVAAAAAGANANNEIGGSTRALIAGSAEINAPTGPLSVVSRSTATPTVTGSGLAASVGFGAAVGAVITNTSITGVTDANIGGTIDVGSLNVSATANGDARNVTAVSRRHDRRRREPGIVVDSTASQRVDCRSIEHSRCWQCERHGGWLCLRRSEVDGSERRRAGRWPVEGRCDVKTQGSRERWLGDDAQCRWHGDDQVAAYA